MKKIQYIINKRNKDYNTTGIHYISYTQAIEGIDIYDILGRDIPMINSIEYMHIKDNNISTHSWTYLNIQVSSMLTIKQLN